MSSRAPRGSRPPARGAQRVCSPLWPAHCGALGLPRVVGARMQAETGVAAASPAPPTVGRPFPLTKKKSSLRHAFPPSSQPLTWRVRCAMRMSNSARLDSATAASMAASSRPRNSAALVGLAASGVTAEARRVGAAKRRGASVERMCAGF